MIVTSAQASVASEAELREAIDLLTRHLTERVTAEWDAFDPGPSPAGRKTVEERHAPAAATASSVSGAGNVPGAKPARCMARTGTGTGATAAGWSPATSGSSSAPSMSSPAPLKRGASRARGADAGRGG